MKKAQVTIFVIIAVLLVSAVAFVAYMQREALSEKLEYVFQPKTKSVYIFTQNCLENTAQDAIMFVGMQGGYAEPHTYLETELSDISYWYYERKNIKPSLNEVEASISEYVDVVLPLCTNRFVDFPELEIKEDSIKTETRAREKDVFIKVYYPLSIKKGSTVTLIKDFSVRTKARIPKIYEEASSIVEMQMRNPDYVDMDLLLDSNLDISILPYSENETIYSIVDNSTQIKKMPYTFIFASKK